MFLTGRIRHRGAGNVLRMNKTTVYAATLTALVVTAGCATEQAPQPEATTESAPPAAETNKRGAIEVPLGEPVTLTTETGELLVSISNVRLESEGCKAVDYADVPELVAEGATGEIRQVLFKADVEVGEEESPEWLWSSDFYYASDDGEVLDNIGLSQLHPELSFPCEGNKQIIDLPPNSKAKGATTLDILVGSENRGPDVIGYKVDGQRAEWTLPDNWADELAPPVFVK